jgi:predicted RNase H-like HicB family nuclease
LEGAESAATPVLHFRHGPRTPTPRTLSALSRAGLQGGDRQESRAAAIVGPMRLLHARCLRVDFPQRKGSHMKIKVVVHEAEEGGFWAEVPAIPGCASQGETMDELLANIHEAIEGCLSVDVAAPKGGGGRVLEIAV